MPVLVIAPGPGLGKACQLVGEAGAVGGLALRCGSWGNRRIWPPEDVAGGRAGRNVSGVGRAMAGAAVVAPAAMAAAAVSEMMSLHMVSSLR